MSPNYWLMKAEPDSRIVKGKDVKFSVDDFEDIKITPWEGVRNHEAKKSMQAMKVGDQVFFYHSNCKNPGIAALAEVCKEAYPDHTAWDPKHPYFDEKTKKDEPRWFMVDLKFKERAKHFIPLPLIKRIAGGSDEVPEDITYIGEEGVKAIKGMYLIVRPRLSVQPVTKEAWDAISDMIAQGGWNEADSTSTTGSGKKRKAPAPGKVKAGRRSKRTKEEVGENGAIEVGDIDRKTPKRKGVRRSGRLSNSKAPKEEQDGNDESDDPGGDSENHADKDEQPEGILKNADEGGGNVEGVVVYGAPDEDPDALRRRNEKATTQEDVKVIEPSMKRAVRTRPRK